MLPPSPNETIGDYQERVAAAINNLQTNYAVLAGEVAELKGEVVKLMKLQYNTNIH